MFQLRPKQPKSQKEIDDEIRVMTAALRSVNQSEIPADVMGSYTGTARDGDIPTQDADDL